MISIKFFELLFFAIISIVLINRLLSMLGEIEEDDKRSGLDNKSGFSKGGSIIDVTDISVAKGNKISSLLSLLGRSNADFMNKIHHASTLLGSFNTQEFLLGSKAAMAIIIDAALKKDSQTISELVDKRYVADFMEISNSFEKIDYSDIEASIDDINIFGNNVMIKVSFILKKGDQEVY